MNYYGRINEWNAWNAAKICPNVNIERSLLVSFQLASFPLPFLAVPSSFLALINEELKIF
jgi:hypothetical protein